MMNWSKALSQFTYGFVIWIIFEFILSYFLVTTFSDSNDFEDVVIVFILFQIAKMLISIRNSLYSYYIYLLWGRNKVKYELYKNLNKFKAPTPEEWEDFEEYYLRIINVEDVNIDNLNLELRSYLAAIAGIDVFMTDNFMFFRKLRLRSELNSAIKMYYETSVK